MRASGVAGMHRMEREGACRDGRVGADMRGGASLGLPQPPAGCRRPGGYPPSLLFLKDFEK